MTLPPLACGVLPRPSAARKPSPGKRRLAVRIRRTLRREKGKTAQSSKAG